MDPKPPHSEDAEPRDLEAAVRAHLEDVVDPRLLVLEGLRQAGFGHGLTEEETARLSGGAPDLVDITERHPALKDVIEGVTRDGTLFDEIWPAADGRVRSRGARPPIRRKGSLLRWPARIALGASAVLLAFVMVSSLTNRLQRTTVTAENGQTLEIQLGDGSTARLSPGSALTYVPGARFDRSVLLDGQAFFDVTRDSRRFSVETSAAVVSVLGTRFGVDDDREGTEVVLVSGQVAVASKAKRQAVVVLQPGQRTRVVPGGLPAVPDEVDLTLALPWTDVLIFRETAMARVKEVLVGTRDVAVQLGPGVAELTVTGTFQPQQSAEEILTILAATLEAELIRSPGGFTLTLR